MDSYKEIQESIDNEFKLFITDLFSISGEARKYFYWSVDFFEKESGFSFQHFSLYANQKDRINNIGKAYFNDSEVDFVVNKNSHRNDLLIRNIHLLFSKETKSGQSAKYEYIKEYILWDILQKVKQELSKEIDDLKEAFSEESKKLSEKKKEELSHFTKVIVKQKANFLVTYITYLCSEYTKPIHKFFIADYINYPLTNQGEELSKKLDSSLGYDNTKLKRKLEKLYIHKKQESKLHFVFSRVGGGEKEELRELLEIMGKKDTGKLYRGQANSSWNLDASITREAKYLNNEAEMYYEIQSLKPDAFQNDKTVYERLITMQHFGMPTRLLDITRNPLVAIFFSCNNWDTKDNDGTIYTFVLPTKKSDFLNFEDKKLDYLPLLFNHINTDIDKEKADEFLSKIWFIKGVAKNQRINNQSGDFIFVGKGDDVKQKLHQLPKMTIIIDSQTKKVLLEQLESLNIHGGAVYPDLTHMSNYIRNKYSNADVSVSISELVKEAQKEKPKETVKKIQKVGKKGKPLKDFDFKSIKEKSIGVKKSTFAKFYNLDEDGLSKIIDDFLFTEKEPFRTEIAKIMFDKPSVLKEQDKIDSMWDKIIMLAKMVSGEDEL